MLTSLQLRSLSWLPLGLALAAIINFACGGVGKVQSCFADGATGQLVCTPQALSSNTDVNGDGVTDEFICEDGDEDGIEDEDDNTDTDDQDDVDEDNDHDNDGVDDDVDCDN